MEYYPKSYVEWYPKETEEKMELPLSVLFFGRGNFCKEQLTEKTPWYIHVPLDVVLNTYLLNT